MVLLAPFLAVFDFFALSTVAPTAWGRVHGPLVLAVFSTAYAAGLVTGGVLGDRYGTGRLFRIGAAGYLAGCVICALAPGPGVLLGGRALLGLAAALTVPQAFALTAAAGTYRRLAAVLGSASVTGQAVAALSVTAGVSWRALFVVQFAVAAVMLATARGFPPPAGGRLDAAGLGLGVLVPLSVLVPMTYVRLTAAPPPILLSALTVVPLATAYRRRTPAVFADARAAGAAAATGLAYAFQSVVLVLTALHPYGDPLVVVGYGAAFAVFSLVRGPSRQAALGVPILAVLVLTGYPAIPLVLCGAAMGIALPRLTAKALGGAVPGAAAGTLATVQQFGSAAAVTLAGWLA